MTYITYIHMRLDSLRDVMYALAQSTFFYDVKLPSSIEDVIEHIAINKPAMSLLGKQLDQLDSLNKVVSLVCVSVHVCKSICLCPSIY